MPRLTKQQIFALFVLFIFVGSSAAFALLNVIPITKPKPQLVFDRPLSNAEEAPFLQQNKVIMKFFYSPECPACATMEPVVDQLVAEFAGSLIVEKINIEEWPDETAAFEITAVPTFYLKGWTVDRVVGEANIDELFSRICELFFEPIDICIT
jgi:thioredoxin 1